MQHAYRTHAGGKFAELLGEGVIARNCERSVLNWTFKKFPRDEAAWDNKHFRATYKQKVVNLLAEFKREKSKVVSVSLSTAGDGGVKVKLDIVPQLVCRLQRKELESTKLAWYSPEVLDPNGLYSQAMFKLKQKELMLEAAKVKQDEDYAGMFKCGKCKSKKTTYYQMQTRSADEPMVRFLLISCTAHYLTLFSDHLRHLPRMQQSLEVLNTF